MKLSLPLKIATLAAITLTSIAPFDRTEAATYGEEEVDQKSFVAIAAPYGDNKYNLLVVEQVPGKKQCWAENGSAPTIIDPLLLNFDFTGHCRRSTDSNGYSMRVDGEDHGLDYLLSVVERKGELLLVASSRQNPQQKPIVVGKTDGTSQGNFLKINLNPGWHFTKRTYEGKELGHVYFSGVGSQIAAGNLNDSNSNDSNTVSSTTTTTSINGTANTITTASNSSNNFRDIANDIYKPEIEEAVAMGFIAGFREDNTFRPEDSLTREQLVSMVIGALGTIPNLKTPVANQVASAPYPDVQSSRWSAAKIQWAKENKLVTGYPDGSFKPDKPVTRAELMAVLRRAAEFARVSKGMVANLTVTQTPVTFSDTTGHWSEAIIGEMSSYCRVASPFNETGNSFYPNNPSNRNYAAAATLRMGNCTRNNSK